MLNADRHNIFNSYEISFYMTGICIIVSGAMLYPIPCIQRWRLSREKTATTRNRDSEAGQEEQVALNPWLPRSSEASSVKMRYKYCETRA